MVYYTSFVQGNLYGLLQATVIQHHGVFCSVLRFLAETDLPQNVNVRTSLCLCYSLSSYSYLAAQVGDLYFLYFLRDSSRHSTVSFFLYLHFTVLWKRYSLSLVSASDSLLLVLRVFVNLLGGSKESLTSCHTREQDRALCSEGKNKYVSSRSQILVLAVQPSHPSQHLFGHPD